MTSDETQHALSALDGELLERWRVAMAGSDQVLVGQLVQSSHAVRDAKRTLRSSA